MKVIAGLGNPERTHENNRHNVGFMFLDYISEQLQIDLWESSDRFLGDYIKTDKLFLLKPNTYMNSSGKAIQSVLSYYKIDPTNLFIVHDDLDIKLGEYKIVPAKGPKLHGGINSIEEQLGTGDFTRVRVGVDNRNSDNRVEGITYVLQDFEPQEMKVLAEVFPKIWSELEKGL